MDARLRSPAPELSVLALSTAALVIVGITAGQTGPLPYLILAVPAALALVWRRPVWGIAALLALVLASDQYGEVLADGMEPVLLQALPLFENVRDFTPFSFVYPNMVECGLLLLAGVWLLKSVERGRIQVKPMPCPFAWWVALLTVALTFALGVWSGGDVKIALWEVRALGYLFSLSWLMPQILERARDLRLVLWVMTLALGFKAVQGLYRYFVILHMRLDLEDTFLAHEDPVMFIPLFFLLVTLLHYRAARRLSRGLLVAAPVMLAALVLTQRRIAYVTLPLCAVFFVVQLAPKPRRAFVRWAVPVAALAALYVAAFMGSPSPLGRPIDRALQLFDKDLPSNSYRLVEQANLHDTVLAHPWGVGFGHPFEIVRDLPHVWVFWNYIPHNEILWLWVKSGTLGFVLIMFFFARLIAESTWAHRQLRDPLLRAVAPIVGLAIVNQLVVSYYELQLTYGRNMVYLGTLIGVLATIERWGGLVGPRRLARRAAGHPGLGRARRRRG